MLLLFLLLLFAFLLGSITSAILVCRLLGLPDPRTQGSNNPGSTNVLRIGGKKAAFLVLIADGLKGVIAVISAQLFGFDLWLSALVGLAAFLGHIYPVFYQFKGGKGVATFLAVLLTLNWLSGVLAMLVWLLSFALLRVSSLSALIATLSAPLLFFYQSNDVKASLVVALMSVWIVWTHRSNIARLLTKKETKL